jgi:Ca2+-transporting ATPase
MAIVYDEPGGGMLVVVKGAPEVVIARSAVDRAERERLQSLAHSLADSGARVLAVAERHLSRADRAVADVETELVPLGLVAFDDPLRPKAAASIREARAGGIRVRMVTGDHPATALAIGRALALPDEAVHARISPADKLAIVEELQGQGEVVAVTGDGVNDAPALRRADVGIAMGRSGTEAAREASAVVLTDDDFSTIVAAVREGRRISDNIRTFVAFLLSANLGEVVLFGIAVLGGLGTPLTVVQVLTVNVLTDGAPAVALSRDREAPDAMIRGPRRSGTLFSRRAWAVLAAIGGLVGLSALGAYLVGRQLGGGVEQTMAFLAVAFAELALAFSIRTPDRPAWRGTWNPALGASVAGSAALALLVVYVPSLRDPFGTVALSAGELGVAVGISLLPAALVELAKALAPRSAYAFRAGGEAR